MSLKFRVFGERVGPAFRRNLDLTYGRLADATRFALNDARNRIITAGRADIAKGGNFGRRWQEGLKADITPEGRRTANLIMSVYHEIPYARVFEFGALIKGRPLLWIPLPWNPHKVRARDFPGRLFRVNRKGKKNPLLMQSDGAGKATAMYVGVKQVRLKRRFHLRTIVRRVAKQIPFLFKRAMRLARKR